MIKLVMETTEFNSFEFTLNFYVPLYCYSTEDNYVMEDWEINPNLFVAPKNANIEYLKQARQLINDILTINAIPELTKIVDYSNKKFHKDYQFGKPYYGNSGKQDNEVSVSYYINVSCTLNDINCSDTIKKSLSNFKIRIANHISPQEKSSIIKKDNVKLFSEQVIGLYESLFIRYTNNIFTTYSQFLDNLSNYDSYIDTFNDIKTADIDFIKSIAVQGEFPNFKGGFV